MKKTITAAAHEKRLNQTFADNYSEAQAVDNFIYLTNSNRGKHTTVKAIRTAHNNQELGTLLRKYDPIAFNVSKGDY
jgi:hypothetical protein